MVFYKGANAKPLIAERSNIGVILFRQNDSIECNSVFKLESARAGGKVAKRSVP
jgi:hypothetical protein